MATPRPTSTPGASRSAGRWAVAGVLAALALVFVIEDTAPVALWVIVPIVVMPLGAALAAVVLVGALTGLLLGRRTRH